MQEIKGHEEEKRARKGKRDRRREGGGLGGKRKTLLISEITQGEKHLLHISML